ncbi:MAG: hypothetical protein ACM369_15900 [Acidobacteriota bacterium]
MKRIALVAMAAALLGSGLSAAEEKSPPSATAGAHFKLAIITGDKYSQDAKGVFAPDAPKVFAVYRVIAGQGTKVKASWFAEKVSGLEPKTKLAENETTFSSRGEFIGSFNCSKPPQGWPVGSYSVNLYMDGVLKKTLGFRVEKQ